MPVNFTPSDDPCCVCHEIFDSSDRAIVQTRCQHLVHLKWISQWFDPSLPVSNRTCYSCQSEVLPLVLVPACSIKSLTNAEDDTGITALGLAARVGYLEIVRLLLERGADVDACHTNGGTGTSALISATEEGHLDIVELLLKYGASVDAGHEMDDHGCTALMSAAIRGHLDILRVLLDHVANVNAAVENYKNHDGLTVLMLAKPR